MFVYNKLANHPLCVDSAPRAHSQVRSLCLYAHHRNFHFLLAKQPCVWHMAWQVGKGCVLAPAPFFILLQAQPIQIGAGNSPDDDEVLKKKDDD